jgi:hypothetical protein
MTDPACRNRPRLAFSVKVLMLLMIQALIKISAEAGKTGQGTVFRRSLWESNS